MYLALNNSKLIVIHKWLERWIIIDDVILLLFSNCTTSIRYKLSWGLRTLGLEEVFPLGIPLLMRLFSNEV